MVWCTLFTTVRAEQHPAIPDDVEVRFKNGQPGQRAAGEDEEPLTCTITMPAPGTLWDYIGHGIYRAEKLVVKGPINADDFRTMFLGTLDGRLEIIDLTEAVPVDGNVPDDAFFSYDEQLEGDIFWCIHLREIWLPHVLTRIGKWAFACAFELENIVLPHTLNSLGEYAFYRCTSLATDPFVFPHGITAIGEQTLTRGRALKNVIIPSTVKSIGYRAFSESFFESIVIPEGVEQIATEAFDHCIKLKEVTLPSTCQQLAPKVFVNNLELSKATLPEGITEIPEEFFFGCGLTEFRIPSTVKTICRQAFIACRKLTSIDIPSNVETIGEDAFLNCGLLSNVTLNEGLRTIGSSAFIGTQVKELVLPSTLETLGDGSCETATSKLYSKAIVPPVCLFNQYSGPFGEKDKTIDTPLYVPVGTAGAYRAANGWKQFSNIIETNDFPAGVDTVLDDAEDEADGPIYDIYGRTVAEPIPGQLYIRAGKKFIAR